MSHERILVSSVSLVMNAYRVYYKQIIDDVIYVVRVANDEMHRCSFVYKPNRLNEQGIKNIKIRVY